MTKQVFKDTLVYGKCKCGSAAALSDTTVCPIGYMQGSHAHDADGLCDCCDECRQECLRQSDIVDKAFNDMSKNIRDEIDAEILNHLKTDS